VAITLDQALGSNTKNATGGTQTLVVTTGATAAAGSRIVVCASWFDNAGTGTVSCSDGTAYTQDKLVTNGNDKFSVFSRVLVGSLASGSSITLTWSSGFLGGGLLAGACSYLGTTGVDTTNQNTTTGTGFSSGAASNAVADALFVGGAGNETLTTSVGGTNTNGTSRFDIWLSAAQQGMRMLDLITSSTGSQALTGTWAVTSSATTGALVIYSGTAVAAPFGRPNLPFTAPQGRTF
jgi:hypothetical protein